MLQRIKDKIRERILTINVAHLYNSIGKDDILEQIGASWWVGDKEISLAEMKNLKAEAEIFQQSKLWKVLKTDIKYQANQAMYEKAESVNDLVAGKLWLYTLDCFDSRLKELKKIK